MIVPHANFYVDKTVIAPLIYSNKLGSKDKEFVQRPNINGPFSYTSLQYSSDSEEKRLWFRNKNGMGTIKFLALFTNFILSDNPTFLCHI